MLNSVRESNENESSLHSASDIGQKPPPEGVERGAVNPPDGDRPLPRMRSALSARGAYIGIVVAIALATIGGMVALWPQGETPTLKFIEGTPLNETYSGEIFSTTTYECQLYATAKCQKVKLELTSGPDEGSTEALQVNTGGGLPEFAVGDEVRLVKNEIPPGANLTGAVSDYSIIDFERKPLLLWLTIAFAALVILFGRLRGRPLAGRAGDQPRDCPDLRRSRAPDGRLLRGGGDPRGQQRRNQLPEPFDRRDGDRLARRAGRRDGQPSIDRDGFAGREPAAALRRAVSPRDRRGARSRQRHRQHPVLAYVGTSLTTLLVFGSGQVGFVDAVNLEIIASVIVATLVGSIGLICAVPITTALAALLAEGIPAEELAADPHVGHAH